jgi:hypothetical protein
VDVNEYDNSMSEPKVTEIIYRSGKHPSEAWDVMQVIYRAEGRIENSFVLSRAADGTIRRKTDIVLDWWEVVTDDDDLRTFRSHFDERDRLQADRAVSECSGGEG